MNTNSPGKLTFMIGVCVFWGLLQVDLFAGQQSCPRWPGQQGWLEDQMASRESKIAAMRTQAIRLLRSYLNTNKQADQRTDALYRLAELQWERSESSLLQQMKVYDQQLDAFRSGKTAARPQEPRIDLTHSIRIYEEILQKHRHFEQTDTVLYLYGFALNEQGDEEAALGTYRSLIKRFPHSAFVADAHLAIGEYHFSKSEFNSARQQYASVMEHLDSPLYDLALYKTAWCYFKQGQAQEAAKYFRSVLRRSKEQKQKQVNTVASAADLEREALEDLAFTFSEFGGAKEAYLFMKQVGGEDYSIRVLAKLGEVFYRQARFKSAIDSFRMLTQRFPLAEDSPLYQKRIVEAYQRSGQDELALKERRLLAQRFGPGSAWVSHHKTTPEKTAKAIAMAEEALRFVALFRHKQAQKTKQTQAYSLARSAYKEYLTMFADAKEAPNIRFYLGDVLFRLKSYQKAAEQYALVIQNHPDRAIQKEAAYAAILAYDNLMRSLSRSTQAPKKPVAMANEEKGFIKAVETYVAIAPKDKKIPQLYFKIGELLHSRGHYEQGAQQLLKVVSDFSKSRYAEPSADLALDCYSRAGNWTKLEHWAKTFIDQKIFSDSEFGKKLPSIMAEAIFRQAASLARENNHAQAATTYLRLANNYANDSLAPKALFNAAVSFEKSGEKEKAVATYQKIIQDYPQKAADSMYIIAGLQERQYDYTQAANTYSRFADRFPKDKRAAQSRLQAALLYKAQRSYSAQARELAKFCRRYPRDKKTPSAQLERAAALTNANDFRRAEKVLRKYIRFHAVKQANIRKATNQLGLALLRQGKKKAAKKQFEKCAQLSKKSQVTDTERAAAAECGFQLGELVYAEYEKIRLRPPMKRLVRLLKKKAAKLKQAEALFTKVVQAGHMEWASAALFRIGDMYARFAKAIYEAPQPKGLGTRGQELYKQELEKLAFPIEDKALSAFRISHEMAKKHNYYSTWSKKTVKMLRKLDPAQFPANLELKPARQWADSFTAYGLRLTKHQISQPAQRKDKKK